MMEEQDNEVNQEHQTQGRAGAEGVRIIGADEAAEALETGKAAGRRPGDAPKFGDAPRPPEGPRPRHRFPLPGSVDPSDVMFRSPLADPLANRRAGPAQEAGRRAGPAQEAGSQPGAGLPHWTDPPTGEVPRIIPTTTSSDPPGGDRGPPAGRAATGDDLQAWAELPRRGARWKDRQSDWDEPELGPSFLASEEPRLGVLDEARAHPEEDYSFYALAGEDLAASESWETATAEQVPVIAAGRPRRRGRSVVDDLDQDAPELGRRASRRRVRRGSQPAGELAPPFEDPLDGVDSGQEAAQSGQPQSGQPQSGQPQSGQPQSGQPQSGQPQSGQPQSGQPQSGQQGPVRVVTGLAIGIVALILFKVGPSASLVFDVLLVTLGAAELFGVLRRAGFRPATLLGLVATVGIMVAAYVKGEAALGIVVALTVILGLLWYMLGVETARPTVNLAATLLAFLWVGFLGSYAALLLSPKLFPHRHGIAFLLGAAVATVAYDVGALAVGRRFGRRPLAPAISPAKTWEGLAGGTVACLIVSAVVVGRIHPWTTSSALALGVLVSAVAPLGDLCESMVKRDIGIKDMGSILPGHGGILDRIDGLLFVIPATFYLVRVLNLG